MLTDFSESRPLGLFGQLVDVVLLEKMEEISSVNREQIDAFP